MDDTAESIQVSRHSRRRLVNRFLPSLETFALFVALMVAIVLEGGCVYWLWTHRAFRATAGSSLNWVADPNLLGQWTSSTLPQCWLLGGLFVLMYRLIQLLVPPESLNSAEWIQKRLAFLRLWRWVVALALLQGLALYLGEFGPLP